MKLYNLTNLKTGHVYRNQTQADLDKLRAWIPDKKNPEVTGLARFSIEEFDVPVKKGVTFIPDYVLPEATDADAAVNGGEQKKGLDASGQNTHGD